MDQGTIELWLHQNWKWFIPVACVGTAIIFCSIILTILLLVFSVMKSSDVYKGAISRATSHTTVVKLLGEPVVSGWYVMGHITINGNSGKADIKIPISGPLGKGLLVAIATKDGRLWKYDILHVKIDGKPEYVNLQQQQLVP